MAVEIFSGPDHMAIWIGSVIRKRCRVNRGLTSEIDSLVLVRERANRSALTLGENANQRPPRWYLRAKIANESSLGPDFHMTSCAIGTVDQHRSYRRLIWIRHR